MGNGHSSTLSIHNLKQWQLFQNIYPLFILDHPWTGITHDDRSVILVWAPVLKAQILEVPLHVPVEVDLTKEIYGEFERQIDILLSNLELLVNGEAVSQCLHISPISNKSRYSSSLKHKYPNLSDLSALNLDYKQSAATGEFSKYLCLRQRSESFKRICQATVTFLDKMTDLWSKGAPNRPIIASSSTYHYLTEMPQSNLNHQHLKDSTKALFNALVELLENCDTMPVGEENIKLEHKVRLRLKQVQDLQSIGSNPEVGLVLASCQNPEWWYPMLFQLSRIKETYPPVFRGNICNGQTWLQRVFKFHENNLHELTPHPIKVGDPTKSFSELLASGILKDRYIFTPLDRKILALTLAYALLQFFDGPWTQTLWTPDNLFFMFDEEDAIISNIREPYISCILSQTAPHTGTLDDIHQYPLILCFAKLLIELETGEELKAEIPRKGNKPSFFYSISQRYGTWSNQQLDDACHDVLGACLSFTQRCMEYKSENPGATVQDVILVYIVDPLKSRVSKNYCGEHHTISLRGGSSISSNCAKKVSNFEPRDTQSSTGIGRMPNVTPVQTASPDQPTTAAVRAPRVTPPLDTIYDNSFGHYLFDKIPYYAETTSLKPGETATNMTSYLASISTGHIADSARDGHRHNVTSSSNSGFSGTLSQNSKLMQNASETSFKYINGTVAERLLYQDGDEIIKIAILDTGLDLDHEDFQKARTVNFLGDQSNPIFNEPSQRERVVAYRDFCYEVATNSQDGDHISNDVEDFDGHGTKVAGIVLRLAPRAQLLVARICVGENNDRIPEHLTRFRKPKPEVVARAVRWAIQEKVHIINMSFGFRRYSLAQLNGIKVELEKARNANIITFAATSNDGFHEDVAWPANDSALAIGVHSCADSGGTKSKFTSMASNHGVNLMVVGEKILSQQLRSKGGGFCLCSGASFATPVVTAISAIILAFAGQQICEENRDNVETEMLEQIRTKNGMFRILKAISKRIEQEYWSLSTRILWADYRDTGDDDEWKAREHAWNIIIKALRP